MAAVKLSKLEELGQKRASRQDSLAAASTLNKMRIERGMQPAARGPRASQGNSGTHFDERSAGTISKHNVGSMKWVGIALRTQLMPWTAAARVACCLFALSVG